MKARCIVSLLAICAVALTFSVSAAEKKAEKKKAKLDLSKIKCPITGKAVKAQCCVVHNGGKVYVCCGKCVKALTANADKYAAKSNHQLVATKQAVQKKCPYSGGKLNPKTKISIAGVNVCFCCGKCKAKTEKADNQVELVFNNKAFAKGFKVKKSKE